MILETNCLNQIRLIFFTILQILTNNLFKTVDIELLLKGGIKLTRISKLFIGLLFIFHMFKLEKCVTHSQFGAIRKLFDAVFEHSVHLFDYLSTDVLHIVFSFTFLTLNLEWTITFVAYLLMFLDITDKQHIAVSILLLSTHQLQYVRKMCIQLFASFEFQIA